MKKNVFFWGAKYKAGIIYNLIEKQLIINCAKNISVKYLFDPGLTRAQFVTKAKFSNKKKDLKNFIKNSDFFVVCVGNHFGKARYMISKKLEKNLSPISIISEDSYISEKKFVSKGVQIFPKAVVQENTTIGEYTILNTASIVEHDCKVGNGVHIMPGAVIGGNVKIGNFATIGLNATILPNLKIEEGAYIGAGSVIVKDVKKNHVIAGNPGKFLKKINHKVNIKFL
tara:strand:+ start:2708 stop:3388 length:681 start_codon:yes stop_codon:yes gene_type:complete